MPFRNNGTFLENIILVAISAYAIDKADLDFVNSFAMPPLSHWVDDSHDSAMSPEFLSKLISMDLHGSLSSYPALLQRCLQADAGYGPNGAFLLVLLAARQNKNIRMWLNDIPDGRYGDATVDLRQIAQMANKILGDQSTCKMDITVCSTSYPASLLSLCNTLKTWTDSASSAILIAYLDPWYYRITPERSDSTSSSDHQQWLKFITSAGHDVVISIHFTANFDRLFLQKELKQMYQDGLKFGFDGNIAFVLDYFAVSVSVFDKLGRALIIDEIYDNIINSLMYYSSLNEEFSPQQVMISRNGEKFTELNLEVMTSKVRGV
ncbi:MAG: hypothetical protein A3C55_00445 [Gammaproteobacteria bacterium RIFCSPHIGHO2_02_FULL_42_13]|nr:MAG: hypothetical protein A3C55_00445 [Gammaproteobacteria bacterium RIFCSPHIGHO2_02_FULL_42_13]OGT68088.1 MAG: hypothetical protein A3H43_04210 [Gammaproteobacteria bacterium RIFCSPLOWO2_02_FULL_42_9]